MIRMTMFEAFIEHFNKRGVREEEITYVSGYLMAESDGDDTLSIEDFKKKIEGIIIEGESRAEVEKKLQSLMEIVTVDYVSNEDYYCNFWQEEAGVYSQHEDAPFSPRISIE